MNKFKSVLPNGKPTLPQMGYGALAPFVYQNGYPLGALFYAYKTKSSISRISANSLFHSCMNNRRTLSQNLWDSDLCSSPALTSTLKTILRLSSHSWHPFIPMYATPNRIASLNPNNNFFTNPLIWR